MKPVLTFLLMLFVGIGYAQDYKTEFFTSYNEEDTVKQLEVLTAWEQADPQNAELFTCYFNYYVSKARQELITLTQDEPEGENMVLSDSTGATAGYLGSQVFYDSLLIAKGLKKIDEGIALYPNRLDMRFGKIYVFELLNDWDRFTEEILTTIQYSSINNNEWTWTDNELQPEGKEFFLGNLQEYQYVLYNTGDDNLLLNMRTIAEEVLTYYPDNVENLSNISVTYLITGEPEKAVEYLLKAEQLRPEDAIVLGNLAQGYKLMGNKEKAIEYYNKVMQYGEDAAIEYAKEQIEELKE